MRGKRVSGGRESMALVTRVVILGREGRGLFEAEEASRVVMKFLRERTVGSVP